MPYIAINQVRYYYEEAGSGAPLVLLHGFTGSLENWASHQANFSRHYRTIAIDLIGHGRTDSPKDLTRYRMENCARDLKAILTELAESEPVNLLGYSMGGRLALYMAVACPAWINRLVLESASPGLKTEAEKRERIERDEQLKYSIIRDGIASFVQKWEKIPLFASHEKLAPPVRAKLRGQRMKNNPLGLANSLIGMGTGVQPSLWESLSGLEMPVLLMAGALDHKFMEICGQTAELIPDARLEIIHDAGHTIHLEQPHIFQKLVLQFLSSNQKPKNDDTEKTLMKGITT